MRRTWVNVKDLGECEVHSVLVSPAHRKEEWSQAGSGAVLGQGGSLVRAVQKQHLSGV